MYTNNNIALTLLLALALALSLLSATHAHSYLTRPEPYSKRRPDCKSCGVCQKEERNPRDVHHTAYNPVRTWGRGEQVDIRWAKNNHEGGFVRLAFLPLNATFDAASHKRLAFYYGCWEQGLYRCRGADCGADNKRRGFRRVVTVPDILPDGVYTFAYLWYGGLDFRRRVGLFSDFSSCSYVRIRGGAPLAKSFQPFFSPGELGDLAHHGQCLTSATKPGECLTGCDYKPSFYAIPASFQGGKQPEPLTPADYGYDMTQMKGKAAEQPTEEEPTVPARAPATSPEPVAVPTMPTPDVWSGVAKPKPSKKGLCNFSNGICCATSCGVCDQEGCLKRKGGKKNCCPWYIRNVSGRKCADGVGAPCHLNGGKQSS